MNGSRTWISRVLLRARLAGLWRIRRMRKLVADVRVKAVVRCRKIDAAHDRQFDIVVVQIQVGPGGGGDKSKSETIRALE